jgi:hypothetical protein
VADPIQELDDLARSLQRLRFSVLGMLAVGGAVVAASGDLPSTGPFTKVHGLALALGLATGAIFARQAATAPRRPLRQRIRWLMASYLAAGAIGLTGIAVALLAGERTTGLGYLAAGALFVLGAPRVVLPGRPGR